MVHKVKTVDAILVIDKKTSKIMKFVYTAHGTFDVMLPRFKEWEKAGKLDIVYAKKDVPLTEVEAKAVQSKGMM
jgi:hypothetical protein